MDLWAVLVTGGVGLAAGQVGAWLQARRDAAADKRRQSGEIERLNLQLADSREQQATERAQRDLLEWRERRLAVFQVASTAYQAISKNTLRLTRTSDPVQVVTAITRIRDGSGVLEDHLDKSMLISTSETRDRAWELMTVLGSLMRATEKYERWVVEIVNDPNMGQAMLTEIVADRLRRLGRIDEPSSTVEDAEAAELAKRFERESYAFIEIAEAWRDADRIELGVPS
ncbi:hypothetical protein [Kribbella sp. NBC_00889]|uniref:hypothetical protein n=1 Tax=Kribbella sp. NBC_00889 TaxID=2975974 RepID=UPI003869EE44|nr:hypothetical protein OG817_39095 [Kribbella sp. NBC_00889]